MTNVTRTICGQDLSCAHRQLSRVTEFAGSGGRAALATSRPSYRDMRCSSGFITTGPRVRAYQWPKVFPGSLGSSHSVGFRGRGFHHCHQYRRCLQPGPYEPAPFPCAAPRWRVGSRTVWSSGDEGLGTRGSRTPPSSGPGLPAGDDVPAAVVPHPGVSTTVEEASPIPDSNPAGDAVESQPEAVIGRHAVPSWKSARRRLPRAWRGHAVRWIHRVSLAPATGHAPLGTAAGPERLASAHGETLGPSGRTAGGWIDAPHGLRERTSPSCRVGVMTHPREWTLLSSTPQVLCSPG
jgi:hypothetical protein